MVIGRVACGGEDDSVTKASPADMSSAGPYQEEESSPTGTGGSKAHYRCAALPAAPWHCEMRFSLHMSAQPPGFHYLYLRVGSNKALLPALEICHPAREQSCCHCTSADLKWCSGKHILTLLSNTQTELLAQSDGRFDLCEFLKDLWPSGGGTPPLLAMCSHAPLLSFVTALFT